MTDFEFRETDVDSDFDVSDNSCDLCISQLDNSVRKIELYTSGKHLTNAYVHGQCLAKYYDGSDNGAVIKKLVGKIWGSTFLPEGHITCKHVAESGIAGSCNGCDSDLCAKCLEGHHQLGHDIVEKETEEPDSE